MHYVFKKNFIFFNYDYQDIKMINVLLLYNKNNNNNDSRGKLFDSSILSDKNFCNDLRNHSKIRA